MRNPAWFPRTRPIPATTKAKIDRKARRRAAVTRMAEEIGRRYGYDPAKMERHARLLDALDPGCAEAIREIRVPGRRVA